MNPWLLVGALVALAAAYGGGYARGASVTHTKDEKVRLESVSAAQDRAIGERDAALRQGQADAAERDTLAGELATARSLIGVEHENTIHDVRVIHDAAPAADCLRVRVPDGVSRLLRSADLPAGAGGANRRPAPG